MIWSSEKENEMSSIGIKIVNSRELAKCLKIVRKYCDFSIGEIKEHIANNEYILQGNYVDEEDVELILKLHNELNENGIDNILFEHDRESNAEFFSNLLEMYSGINKDIDDIIDSTSE